MNANWLAPIIFTALGLWFLSVPIQQLRGVPMDGYAPGLGLMMAIIWFFLAVVATRELLRRKRLPNL
jgi:hypothetical protein